MADTWQRPWFVPTAATMRAHFMAFVEEEVELDISASLDGAPDGAERVPLRCVLRNDRSFVDGQCAMLEQAVAIRGNVDAKRLKNCVIAQIQLDVPDAAELVGLQSAVAMCHAFSRVASTAAILDMLTGVFWESRVFSELPPARGFEVAEHTVHIFDERSGNANTRGLVKFARADLLVRGVTRERAAAANLLMTLTADALSGGKAWRPGPSAAVLHGPGGKLPPITFVPPPAELQTETWGNRYMEIRDLAERGPGEGCSRVLEALKAQLDASSS